LKDQGQAVTTLSFSLDRRVFVEEYWQRKPAVLKNVLPGWHSPLDPEDLAGLAMEADVDSRIVAGQAGVWSLAKGPFTATDFRRNGAWSLLVNAVDQWVPAVASLRNCVDFLPGWRFDDVMVSYATDGGSVGPHFDRYDVFLLQGQGHRLWRLGGHCDASTPCIDHEGLHLLENFTAEAEYLLEPGDALYLPPGIAHWGIARGECMTYSLGFRAPRVSDLVARMADDLLEKLDPDLLLEDKSSIFKPPRPGELTADHLTNAREAVLNALIALDDGSALGELVTEAGEAAPVPPSLGDSVKCFPGARLLWQRYGDSCRVFANGEQLIVHGDCRQLLEALCRGAPVSRHALQRADVELESLLRLQGILIEAED
jgi:50S ribosomal protein L16 3-hydroxylase